MYSLVAVLGLNACDIGVGVISAVKQGNIESSKLRDGIFKKTGFWACYAVAYIIDHYGSYIGFSGCPSILPPLIGYISLTEIVSILENVSKINPDLLPDKLMQLFKIKGGK